MAQADAIPAIRPPGPRQRWASVLVLLFGLVGVLLGLVIREQVSGATVAYSNLQAGINVSYPANWLLEEGGRDFVFRIRDLSAPGFATTLQVAVHPVSAERTARNLFDASALQRSRSLAAYTIIAEQPYRLPGGQVTKALRYFYVSTGDNPFLDSMPAIVDGLDILIIERDQALEITWRADAESFEREMHHLQRFLASLDF